MGTITYTVKRRKRLSSTDCPERSATSNLSREWWSGMRTAVRNAINNTGKVIMKNHISHCIVEAIEQDDLEAVEALNHAIDHFIK